MCAVACKTRLDGHRTVQSSLWEYAQAMQTAMLHSMVCAALACAHALPELVDPIVRVDLWNHARGVARAIQTARAIVTQLGAFHFCFSPPSCCCVRKNKHRHNASGLALHATGAPMVSAALSAWIPAIVALICVTVFVVLSSFSLISSLF